MQAALRSSAAALRSTFLLQQLRGASAATTATGDHHRPSYRLLPPVYGNGNACAFSTQGTYLDKSVVTERVLAVVKKLEKVEPAKVNPEAHFQNDLGLDSLDSVELVMAFEEEFQIEVPDAQADKIFSCSDAIDYISSQPRAK